MVAEPNVVLDVEGVLVDPRGEQEREPLKLAKRPTLEQLKQGKVLFYNNTKLDFCNYGQSFVTVKDEFRKRGITNFVDHKETVRGKTTADFRRMAQEFAKQGFVAAVLAMGDMGTSPATTVLTIELERVGIPSVYITAPPGSPLTEAVALLRAGHLCLCSIDIYQASTAQEVADEIWKKMDYIIDSLTLAEDEIERCAKIDLNLDVPPPAGTLEIPQTKAGAPGEAGYLMEEIMDMFQDLHLGDGLPIIPPTPRRVNEMMAYCPHDPGEVLAREIGPSGADIRVKDVVVSAVMAGCKPSYMPILIAAFKAMAQKSYNFLQSVTTSHPGGNMVLVSGPLAQELGIYGGQGCLGPGFHANATIGRAVNLVLITRSRSVPGVADLDCLASQAEYTYCFAEDPTLSPWPLMHQERYDDDTTMVYVLKAEPIHDIIEFLTDNADELLESLVDSCMTLGSNNAYVAGPLVLVITPDHSWILERDGWDKPSLRNYLHHKLRWPREKVIGRGLVPVRPPGFDRMEEIPVTRSPEDIEIVVAGGRGGHSGVILPWALHSGSVVEPVVLPGGSLPKSIEEFRG